MAIHRKRPGKSHTLPHAAGKLMRKSTFKASKAYVLYVLFRPCLAFAFGDAAKLQTERHIAQNVGPREKRKVLKDKGPVLARAGDRISVNLNFPTGRFQQSSDDF